MKFEPIDETRDAKQIEASKQAKDERAQMKRERAAQTEKLRQERIARSKKQ